jgi:hypothetical protein
MAIDPPVPTYTSTILKVFESILGSQPFAQYSHVITRVFSGNISAATSITALGLLFSAFPSGIVLHNEVAVMTHDVVLIHNLPELFDDSSACGNSDGSLATQLTDMVDRFAEMEGRRPEDARDGREQVMRWLGEMLQAQAKIGQQVDDLVVRMGAMAF